MTTTSYGTWANRVDPSSTGLDQTVYNSLGTDHDGLDVDAITDEYHSAINAALPDSVALAGDEFIGPYHDADRDFDGYPLTGDGRLDIKAIVDGIDFWAIVQRHDHG